MAVSLALIVAVADNAVIGRGNDLPWHLPDDLKYFKRVTMGKPLIMGRKTFESIGRPLPGRANLVLSRDPDWQAEGVQVGDDPQHLLAIARQHAEQSGVDEVMVIGGAGVYASLLPLVERLYVTRVHAEIDGDVYFPLRDWSAWQRVSQQEHSADAAHQYPFSFEIYTRKNSNP